MSGPILFVSVGLAVLVLLFFLMLALVDPDSIVNGSRWLNRGLHGRGGEHPLEH